MRGRIDTEEHWRLRLREARRRLDLTQDGVAERAGVSKETVRSYEEGRHRPGDRQHIMRILEAVELSRLEINDILEELGFAPVRDLAPQVDGAAGSRLAAAQRLIDACLWPAFAANDLVEVVAANESFQALFDVDFAREYRDAPSRSLLALMTTPRFADHFENWDEIARVLVALWKGHFTRTVSLDDPRHELSKVLDSLAGGDSSYYLLRVLKIWAEARPIPPVRRWFYPIVWRDDELGLLTFQGVVHTGDDPETLVSFNDWIPTDAATWSAFERVKSRHVAERR